MLLSLGLLYDIAFRGTPTPTPVLHKMAYGMLIGGIAIVLMLTPVVWEAGIIFDTRTILLGLTGLFFGAIPTFLAMAIAAAYRLSLGGAGALAGVATILSSGLIGLAWRRYRFAESRELALSEMYVFGGVVQAAMILCLFLLPQAMARKAIASLALPIIIIYPVCTALLGNLLAGRQRRYRLDRELAHEKALFEAIFNGIPDAIVYADVNRNIVAINRGFTSVFGYTMDDLAGRKTSYFYESEDEYERQGRQRFNLTSTQQTRPYQVTYRKKNGVIFAGETLGTVIKGASGEALGYIGVIRDITERKQAEESLRESKERLSAIFDVANVGVSITDANGRYMMFNSWWKDKLGYSDEEMRRLTNIDITHAEDKEESSKSFRELVNGKTDRYRLEKRYVTKSQSIFWADLSASAIKDRNNRVTNVVGMVTDITERKHAEAAQAQFEAQLRESQKMEALGTLAGGVAHDFNNALATIIGNAELARQDVGSEHAALESLEEITKASRRAKNLVQQILAFSRRQTTERKIVSLAPAVHEAARLLRSTLPAGINLNVDCAPDAPLVSADSNQIEQIILNLCSNAWHALQGERRAGVIDIRLAAEVRHGLHFASLTVRDNGVGMDEAIRIRIFEPFFTTKGVGEGTGLGLSVVHGIAKEHGASIEVESAPGKGTAFVIYFPAAQPSDALALAPGKSMDDAGRNERVALQGAGKHILYVDDDESIVFLMTRMLERQGYRVSGYANPHEALAAARVDCGQIDLAVTDYNMPGMSGLELASALREVIPDLPVVLATGYITEELRQKAPASGVSELIYKPNSVDELCKAVAHFADAQGRSRGSS
ncbi:MAG: PAS domain S-box protein [Burkholderiales bacterium]|nr:PAS domain S-box protein [Burkholderiales bacterium]